MKDYITHDKNSLTKLFRKDNKTDRIDGYQTERKKSEDS